MHVIWLSFMLTNGAATAAESPSVRLGPPAGHVFTALHFGENVEFFRPGLYYGSLPADHPESQRAPFVRALKASGVRALRFPGGNAAYYYLAESAALTMQLAHATGHWEYREDLPHNNHFVTLDALAGLARQADLKLIYQLPVLFHLDGDTPRATIRSQLSDTAGNHDRDRTDEGAAYAAGIVRRLRELGAPVAAWELGNEEFALCNVRDYAAVCAATIRAVRAEDPKTRIVVVGMGQDWVPTLIPALKEHGVLAEVNSYNAHYPFGHWPGPGDESRRGDPTAFAMGDLRMDRWLQGGPEGRAELGAPGTLTAVTETTMMHIPHWDAHSVVPTHAHALVYAWNWLTMLADPSVNMAVLHDLETPFFGLMRYNVGLDPATQHFVWLDAPDPPAVLDPTFPGEYVLSPTCLAQRLLAGLEGSRPLQTTVENGPETVRCLAAGREDGRLALIAVNRAAESVLLRVPVEGSVEASALTADSLGARLPGEFRTAPTYVRPSERGTEVRLPAWSVTMVEGEPSG